MAIASPPDTARPDAAGDPLAVVRAAGPAEAEQARELQRAAFSLPSGPPPIPGWHEEIRVAVQGQRVVSCLTVIRAELCVRGACVPMGGIRHVATHPEEQNRGHASALIRDTLARLRREGVPASVLFPFSFRYYRKFGYELGGNHCQFWCRPSSIPAYLERRDCRPLSPEDSEDLQRFHEALSRGAACCLARNAARWRAVCADPSVHAVAYDREGLRGYALLKDDRDSYGGRVLRILDLQAGDTAAWRGLLGYLSQAQAESVEWYASAEGLSASGLLRSPAPLREGFKPRGIATVRPMFQFRVVDLPGAVRARLDTFPDGAYSLALRVTDELLPDNQEPLLIHAEDGRPEIRSAPSSAPGLEADIRVFSQIYCGYMSPAEAVSQGLARCTDEEALQQAERLFPAGEPFISELDRF